MKLAALLPFVWTASVLAQQAAAPPSFRLGNEVRPVRYQADLRVVPAEDTFSGVIDIELDIRSPQSAIWTHAVELTFDGAELRVGSKILAARITTTNSFAGFLFDSPVRTGKATLHAVWHGKLNSKSSAGLFKNRVGDDWYAFTQFEATDARRVFPCFDEPGFKVPWQLTLHVKREHMALSNTSPVSEREEANGMKAVTFAPTRPLPSYLVAFAVGPFEAVDAGTAGPSRVPMRVITPKGMASQARYAAETVPQLLTELEKYFGIPYPYGKLDSIAVPLFGGAMENPGLITYGLTILLASPAQDSIGRQRSLASIAAHEMAHMWFGDLVTMAWWDDIWLNEAFASWMEEKTVAAWKPEWKWQISSAANRQSAMESDSLVTARQIRQPVLSRDDIVNAFDNITYGKGASVIYMFEQWIGPEVFRKGVQEYLREHADGNATANEFLAAISKAAGRSDIAPAFSTFLDQAGVPLVTSGLKCTQGRKPMLALTQKRYLPLGSQAPAPQVWQIPICLRADGGHEVQCSVLATPTGEIQVESAKECPAWVMLNAHAAGYYRTLYRGQLLENLISDGGKALAPEERVAVMGDAEALFRGGELQAGEALRLATVLSKDPARQVVKMTVDVVAGLSSHLVSEDLRPNYQRFIRDVYGARAREFGWLPKPGESDDVRLLRPSIVTLVADQGGDPELVEEAGKLARKWIEDRSAIPAEMAGAVMRTAARNGNQELFELVTAALGQTKDARQREILLSAMSSFRDPAILKQDFEMVLAGKLDVRESAGLLFAGLGDPRTREIPFELVRANYDRLAAVLPHAGDVDYAAYLPMVGQAFCSQRRHDEVEAFFKDRSAKAPGGPRILAQVLEGISQCAATTSAQEAPVAEFLRKY